MKTLETDIPIADNEVNSSPTKQFFVEMLTRDIELTDAILDLLDNCLDGAVRSINNTDRTGRNYYAGYKAQITITSDKFIILDNCGGISKEIAKKYAFRMGRDPNDKTGENNPTVGVYGIGMKRAIFKIGSAATVTTKCANEQFQVKIPNDWVRTTKWTFQLDDIDSVPDLINDGGTVIEISNFTSMIKSRWKDKNLIQDYVSNLVAAIRDSYSFIIEKGFEITINDVTVNANPVQFKLAKEPGKQQIKPYIYKNIIDDVKVSFSVGFYSPIPTSDEIEEYDDGRRSSAEAGWTIICNDRVILYNDKTHLTGWGEAGVPKYHTQFIGIRGIVFFESLDPKKLPTTTTKRGINLNSALYAQVKEQMRNGLKVFTNYTNKWKNHLEEEREHYSKTESVSIQELLNAVDPKESFGIEYKKFRGNKTGGEYFMPDLPMPQQQRSYENIRYVRPKEDVSFLCSQFFDDILDNVGASKVGEACFDRVLDEFKRSR